MKLTGTNWPGDLIFKIIPRWLLQVLIKCQNLQFIHTHTCVPVLMAGEKHLFPSRTQK